MYFSKSSDAFASTLCLLYDEFMQNGPLLFFSGGTALRETSVELARQKVPSTHIITTFDSGGSSAALREAFSMPAVGDLRSRIISLASLEEKGVPEACALLQYRLQHSSTHEEAVSSYKDIMYARNPLCVAETQEIALIRKSLTRLLPLLPETFHFSGASIGNLVLAERFLAYGRKLRPAIAFLSSLVHCAGQVESVSEIPAHLAVKLASGEIITGQHCFTGKQCPPINSPINDLWLCQGIGDYSPVAVEASESALAAINSASCIFFPIGSFFSSVVANLLPIGIVSAVQKKTCPKIFIPNPGNDPELFHYTVVDQVKFFLKKFGSQVITHVIFDKKNKITSKNDRYFYEKHNISLYYADLLGQMTPFYDSKKIINLLFLCDRASF